MIENKRQMNERDVTMLWSRLFRGQDVTSLTFEAAEGLLAELSPENPLRHRYQKELDDLRKRHQDT